MSVYCDACETELGDEVSDCCKADVWGVFRALTGSTYICQECGKECNLVKQEEAEDYKYDEIGVGLWEAIGEATINLQKIAEKLREFKRVKMPMDFYERHAKALKETIRMELENRMKDITEEVRGL